jgi:flagellar basal body-associated protein FliL
MLALFIAIYLLTGVGTAIWFLADATRTKVTLEDSEGTTSQRRVIQMMYLPTLIGFLLLMLALGPPIIVARFLFKQEKDNEEGPQDRVPPKYR